MLRASMVSCIRRLARAPSDQYRHVARAFSYCGTFVRCSPCTLSSAGRSASTHARRSVSTCDVQTDADLLSTAKELYDAQASSADTHTSRFILAVDPDMGGAFAVLHFTSPAPSMETQPAPKQPMDTVRAITLS